MQRLKLASTKIPIELVERLARYTESTGSTQSAVIRQAIEQFLDSVESTGLTELTAIEGSSRPSELVARVDSVDNRLTELEARLTQIEGRSAKPIEPIAVTQKAQTSKKTSPKPIDSSGNEWLTIGEALTKLEARGCPLGRESLRLALKPAIDDLENPDPMPKELSDLGLSGDFELRRSAKKFANNTRWLRVD